MVWKLFAETHCCSFWANTAVTFVWGKHFLVHICLPLVWNNFDCCVEVNVCFLSVKATEQWDLWAPVCDVVFRQDSQDSIRVLWMNFVSWHFVGGQMVLSSIGSCLMSWAMFDRVALFSPAGILGALVFVCCPVSLPYKHSLWGLVLVQLPLCLKHVLDTSAHPT